MGNNYHIKKEKNKFLVIENFTDQVIVKKKKYDDAKKVMRKLENGYGFAGNTPPFFLKDIKVTLN